jgi:uncharacterized membrane protein
MSPTSLKRVPFGRGASALWGALAGALAGAAATVPFAVERTAIIDVAMQAGALCGLAGGALWPAMGPAAQRAAGIALAVVVARALSGPMLSAVLLALALAILVAKWSGARWERAALRRAPRAHLLAALLPATCAFVIYTLWSVTRHLRFGSGSWDLGIYNHNAWLFAHGKPFISSVLGDVSFWGGTNHFMPSLVFTAPLAWMMEVSGTTSLLLVAQAALIALAAVPLAALARRFGLGPLATGAVCSAFLFHVGVQSAANFDVHEIAPVPLLLFTALWAAYAGKRWLVYAALLVLIGTKESAILYGAATGMMIALFVPGFRRDGAAIAALCVLWFYVVTGVIQPALLEPGGKMIHVLRFSAFGTTTADATLGMLAHPGRALVTLFTPPEKMQTHAVTWGAFAFLPLASVEAMLLALPNLAERFLSDKREMWGLGFHYSLVTAGYAAFGSAIVLGRIRNRLRMQSLDGRFDVFALALLTSTTIFSCALSPIGFELSSLEKSYFATPAEAERYRRALALIPDDANVVAQNHFLPHVSLREHVWLPEQRFIERAQWVVLDPAASPWPHNAKHVQRLLDGLRQDARFELVFSEQTTFVWRRREGSDGIR